MAERAGFEPAVRGYRTLAFQASAFDRSATSPEFCTAALFFYYSVDIPGGISRQRSVSVSGGRGDGRGIVVSLRDCRSSSSSGASIRFPL